MGNLASAYENRPTKKVAPEHLLGELHNTRSQWRGFKVISEESTLALQHQNLLDWPFKALFPYLATADNLGEPEKNVTFQLGKIDSRNCPFNPQISVLPDQTGVKILLDTKSGSLASIGPGVPSAENRKRCYLAISFSVSPNRRLTFGSLNIDAPTALEKDVKATVSTDFAWSGFAGDVRLSEHGLSGPHDGSWKVNQTDEKQQYQSYCANYNAEDTTYDLEMHIQTFFDLKSSNPSARGEIAKDATVEEILRLSYGAPDCPYAYEQTPSAQSCEIDREGVYWCRCPGEDPVYKSPGKCAQWTKFPPDGRISYY
ncbi:uncharacterized protein EI97DRAFT_446735 [Westerdykella ornata]|uniref:Uncharacterized protein n=1 Tax=Westerdykella ornata TaxID=318751 RepID=A0A6A6J4C4_WESOR|nr:uncharacterized protein EI97DRAFT_446735 [Westerdykella ornata]KAF2271295.1 hypothetical protein EI97DRAFT_446735 [Westerdykella ornata]